MNEGFAGFFLQAGDLQIEANDVGEPAEVVEEEVDDDDDAADSFEPIAEETDEEYVPAAEASCLSTSVPRKRKSQLKTDKPENKEAVEGESKKEAVQCPICNKSFKSKYYLKVHNRYRCVE